MSNWNDVLAKDTNGYAVKENNVDVKTFPESQGVAHSFRHNDGQGNQSWALVDYSYLSGSLPLLATPLTTRGDILTVDATPALARLGKGAAGTFPVWSATDLIVSKVVITQPATGATLTIADNKTFTVNNSLTLSGTDGGALSLAVTNTKTLTLTATNNFNLTIPATGTAALLGTQNIFTAAQRIDNNVGLWVGATDNLTGTIASFINTSTHTRVGIGSSNAGYHSLLSFFNSAGTKKYDVGYDPGNTRFYIYDGTANIFQSTDAGATLIGRLGGSLTFGVSDLSLDGGAGNDYFSFNSTGTTAGEGLKYKESTAEKFALAYLGSATTFTDQYGGYGLRLYNSVTNYTNLMVRASNGFLSIGFGNPATQLHTRFNGSNTTTITNVDTIEAVTSGTPGIGFGAGLQFLLQSSTTLSRNAARIYAQALVSTDASRQYDLVMTAWDTAEREGIRIRASGTAPMLGFLGVTPVAQQANTVALDTLLVNYGLRASGGYANFATTIQPRVGTTAANTAPLKFTTQAAGLTSVEQGAMELIGNSLQFTQLAKRRGIAMTQNTRTTDFTLAASSGTSESAAVETSTHGANYLEAGKMEELVLVGTMSQRSNPNANITIRVKYAGSTVITFATTTSTAIAANSSLLLRIFCTCRSTGVSGTMQINAVLEINGNATDPQAAVLATIDTTTAQDTTVTFQWGTDTDVANTITIHQARVLCIEPSK